MAVVMARALVGAAAGATRGPLSVIGALLAVAAATGCTVEHVPQHPEDAVADVPDTSAAAVAADTALFGFICDDMFRFTVRYEGETATLFLPDTALALERTPAATGARFARAGIELWHRGDETILDLPDAHYPACSELAGPDPWTAALLRGVVFRAVGQEPGWYLEVEGLGMIVFVGDYGDRTVEAPVPEPVRDGTRTEFHAVTSAHELRVFIDETPCTDSMSGERFRATVLVTLDGSEYRGCGRWLGAGFAHEGR